jgi:choline dehydrogenase-like flavoprotein
MVEEKKYNLCVIGAGPAGIITVLEYAKLNPNHRIVLIEFGSPNDPVQNSLDESIEIVDLSNHHPVYECTNKGLGGTSLTWGGRCVTYDEVDFIDRPILNGGCTWDTNLFHEVNKYLYQSGVYFECGAPAFDLTEVKDTVKDPIAQGFKNGDVTDTVLERWSKPTRFGMRYAEELRRNSNITILDGHEAKTFASPDVQGNVSKVTVMSRAGAFTEIVANHFVIAAGAQESTRLLLRNANLFNNLDGIPDALGKYYQGHLSGKIASVLFNGDPKKTDFGFLKDEDGIYLRRRFQFSTDFLVKNNLLNTCIWLDNPLYYDPKHGSGPMSLMYLAMITPVLGKKLAPPAIADSITKGKVQGLGNHIWNIVKGFPMSLITPAVIMYKRYFIDRKLPGVFLYSQDNKYALHFHAEQVPDRNNRMKLAGDGKTLLIDYSLSDDDIQSVIKLHKKLDEWLRATNCGKLEYWFEEEELAGAIRKMSRDGIHQSGTTRIAAHPDLGVVNESLQLFGTANVYVCSSSVFPTSSQANPTFYLGAFAVRLAHYLTQKKA